MVRTRNQVVGSPIEESPAAESGTETTSTLKNQDPQNTTTSISLDDLFQNLQNELKATNNTKDNNEQESRRDQEFEKIKNSIKNLPKLQSTLDAAEYNSNTTTTSGNTSSVREVIYDPVSSLTKKDKKENEDSGKEWFNMPKPEITKQMQNDLLLIQKRDVLDPKRHYKKQKWVQPKFFQVGEIVNDSYTSNLTRKQKGTSLVNELLVNDDAKKYFKRKYTEIQEQKTSGKLRDYKNRQKMRKKF